MKITIEEQIKCIVREINFREGFYPKWISQGKMSQQKADLEIMVMKEILKTLHRYEADHPETDGSLYSHCISIYNSFLSSQGVPMILDGAQGKSMKDIIGKLRKVNTKDKTDQGIIVSWTFILKHWERVGPFIGNQKKLTDINKNLQEILDKIRNGHDKKSASKNEVEQLKLELAQRRQNRTD